MFQKEKVRFKQIKAPLILAVRSGIRNCRKQKTTDEILPRNKRLRAFYDKEREVGKLHKVAVIACVSILLH
jgi:transposase